MSSAEDLPLPYPPGVDPNESRQSEVVGWASAMMVLSAMAVMLRFVSRYLVKNRFQLDDWLAVAALPFAWTMCLIAIWGCMHDHFGQHLGKSTTGSLHRFLVGLWTFDIVYAFSITLSKLSIIALWWRIFEVRSCHIILGVLAGLEMAWLVGVTLSAIFSCVPVQGFWDLTVKSRCFSQSQFWLGAAVPNIIFDVALLVIPNFYVARLAINRSQKFALTFIFMLGIFVTICSGLRLWQLIIYNAEAQSDLTWIMATVAIWSFVEGNLSVVCCCLPSMRPLLRLLMHGRATTGRDYMSNRNSLRSPGASVGLSKRGSRVVQPLPQRLSVGVSKKTEWWETSQTRSSDDNEAGGDSWPLPNINETNGVSTTIYAGDKPPENDDNVSSLPPRGGSRVSSHSRNNSAQGHHSRHHSRNRSIGWSGWIETKLQKPPSVGRTWLQLEDSIASGSAHNSPRESPRQSSEHGDREDVIKDVEAGDQTLQFEMLNEPEPAARRSSESYVRPGVAR